MFIFTKNERNLCDELVGDGRQHDGRGGLLDDLSGPGLGRDALQVDPLALSLGLLQDLLVLLDTAQEVLTALGVADVLNTDVDALGDDAVLDALVHDHSQGMGGHVEDAASLSVVRLVGHALLDGTVSLNVHDVSDLVDLHVGGQRDHSTLPELAREHVSGSATVSLGVRHLCRLCQVSYNETRSGIPD